MDTGHPTFWKGAASGFCALALVGLPLTVSAAPPAGRVAALTQGSEASSARLATSRNVAEHPSLSRLDLRVPADLSLPEGTQKTRPEALSSPFAAEAKYDQVRTRLEADLTAGGDAPIKSLSRAEALAHRFHSEGLPVARLFENHSALVSLGLNQHGKPGLWLIQKLP